jgi:LPXTG-motif cell wall-anchored protein
MFHRLFLDIPPDPKFYEKTNFWVLATLALLALVGLVIWFIKRKKNT